MQPNLDLHSTEYLQSENVERIHGLNFALKNKTVLDIKTHFIQILLVGKKF